MSAFDHIAEEESAMEAKQIAQQKTDRLFKRYGFVLKEIEHQFKLVSEIEDQSLQEPTLKHIADLAYEISFKTWRDDQLKGFCKKYQCFYGGNSAPSIGTIFKIDLCALYNIFVVNNAN